MLCSIFVLPAKRSTPAHSGHMLRHGPEISSIFGQMHMELPVAFDQDRRVCLYRRGSCCLERLGNAGKGRQIMELVNGSEDDRKLILFRAGQGLGWRDPDALAGLQAIMRGLLLRRGGGQKEVSVKALGHRSEERRVGKECRS